MSRAVRQAASRVEWGWNEERWLWHASSGRGWAALSDNSRAVQAPHNSQNPELGLHADREAVFGCHCEPEGVALRARAHSL